MFSLSGSLRNIETVRLDHTPACPAQHPASNSNQDGLPRRKSREPQHMQTWHNLFLRDVSFLLFGGLHWNTVVLDLVLLCKLPFH